MDQVMVKINHNETLISICLQNIVNLIKINKMDILQLKDLPKNINASLLNVLSKRGFLTDENIDVLLKEQTKVLELSECDKLTDISLNKISKCKYLVKIDLNSNTIPRKLITSEGIANLSQSCKYLQALLLRRCINIDDTCIDIIARNCSKLQSLNIANCPYITDNSLISLGNNCKFLKSINVSGTKITDNGIFQMFSHDSVYKSIEEVHIAGCDLITDESIECVLMNSDRIKYLLFHSCPKLTDASRIALNDYMVKHQVQKIKHLTWTVY